MHEMPRPCHPGAPSSQRGVLRARLEVRDVQEEIAFARFKTPAMLAEALASADAETRESAEFAMDAISHTRRRLTDTIGDVAYILHRRADILFFGFQVSCKYANFV